MKNDKDKKLNTEFDNYDKLEKPDKSVLFAAKNELAQKNAQKAVKRKAWLKKAVPIFACLVAVISLVSVGISKLFNSFGGGATSDKDSATSEQIAYYTSAQIGQVTTGSSAVKDVSLDDIIGGENVTLLKEEYYALYFKNDDGTLSNELAAVVAKLSIADGGVKKDITLYLEYTDKYYNVFYNYVHSADSVKYEDGEYVGNGYLKAHSVKCYINVVSPDSTALGAIKTALKR